MCDNYTDIFHCRDERRRLAALEMWIWKRKIDWTDHKTYVEVLEMLGETKAIMTTIIVVIRKRTGLVTC